MKKVVSLLIAIAMVLPLLCLPVSAIEYDAIEYIVNNVDTLAEVYAQLHPDSDEVFEGQSVEFMLPVAIVSTDSVGTYIDFDGENGYMVVQGNNEVIAWEVAGDLTYLKDLESTYFSIVDGFGYLDGGSFILYETNAVDQESMVVDSSYQGQQVAGDGTIIAPEQYMVDRYDSHYQLISVDFLNYTFQYVNQMDYSFYRTASGASEGNCALSSMFALLNYLGLSGKCNLPSIDDTHRYYCTIDPFYEIYADDPDYNVQTSLLLPELYYTVRQYAINPFCYETYGLETAYIDDIIEMAAEHYSNNVDATVRSLGNFDSHVVSELAQDDPVIIVVSNSTTYGNHAMVVTGYHVYRKTTTILGIDFHDYVYLLRVNDNWLSDEGSLSDDEPLTLTGARYFDLTAYNRTCAYITVEVDN